MNEKEKTIEDAILNAMLLASRHIASVQESIEKLAALMSLRYENFRAVSFRIELEQSIKQITK